MDVETPLPRDVVIHTETDVDKMLHPPLNDAFAGGKLTEIGEGVVAYVRNTMEDDPTASMTWLQFYGNTMLFILTYLPGHLEVEATVEAIDSVGL